MTDQDPELRQLLAAARQGMSPMNDDAERVRARLSSVLPASGDVAREPTASPRALARAPRLVRLGWLALGLGVGGLGGYALGQRQALHPEVESRGVGAQVLDASEEPSTLAPALSLREPASVPPPPEASPKASSSAPRLESDAGRPAKASRAHQPRDSKAQAADEQVQGDDKVQGADEVALMKRVNRALGRGEAAWALALLRQIDVEVPQGRLLEERAAGGAIARCMLSPQVGREELARYTEQYPSSVHLARVSQVCTRNLGNSP